MNKAFSATTIKEGFDFQSFDSNSFQRLWKGFRASTVASVGDQAAAETLFFLIFLPQQTFAKWPFFWHLKQTASRAGHLERGWSLFPQTKQVEVPDVTAASVPGSISSWSSVVAGGTAALTDEGELGRVGFGITHRQLQRTSLTKPNMVLKSSVLFSNNLWRHRRWP